MRTFARGAALVLLFVLGLQMGGENGTRQQPRPGEALPSCPHYQNSSSLDWGQQSLWLTATVEAGATHQCHV